MQSLEQTSKSGLVYTRLEQTSKSGLEQELWKMNLTQMNSILVGIFQLPEIVGVRVEDDRGNAVEQIGLLLDQKGAAIVVNREGKREVESADELHKRALDLETALGNKEIARIPKLMAALSGEVSRVMAALAELFPEKDHAECDGIRDGEKPATDMKRMNEILDNLSNLIDEGDSDALALINEIKESLGPAGITDDIRKLESQINEYEDEVICFCPGHFFPILVFCQNRLLLVYRYDKEGKARINYLLSYCLDFHQYDVFVPLYLFPGRCNKYCLN